MLLSHHKSLLGLVLTFLTFPIVSVAQDATAIATASPTALAIVAPQCAQTCVLSSQQVQSNCAETDQACLCQHSAIIQAAISSCLDGTKACSETDKQQAVAYYPQFCASYGLTSDDTVATTGANGIITAAGQAPTQTLGAGASHLVLTSTADTSTASETSATQSSNDHATQGLTVPAILGITLGAFLVVIGVAAFVVYTHVRRRQLKRRTRIDFLTNEFGDQFAEQDSWAIPRPPRSQSVHSKFVVQPTPPEKPSNEFDFGLSISRTSTLVSVAPPLPAKLATDKDLPDMQASAYHVEHVTAPATPSEKEDDTITKGATTLNAKQRTSSLREVIESSGKRLGASLRISRSTTSIPKKAKEALHSKDQDYGHDEFDVSNKI